MPNHVRHNVILRGSTADVIELRKKIQGDKDYPVIDFNKIIEMPEKLRNSVSGSGSMKAKKIIEKIEKQNKGKEIVLEHFHDFLNDGAGSYIKNYIEHGYVDWYDWAIDNWGTKWNAYNQENVSENEFSFETAWSTPYEIMVQLSAMFPKVYIEVNFADEDLGVNCGQYVLVNGILAEECFYNPEDEGALPFACDVWGYDYEDVIADRE